MKRREWLFMLSLACVIGYASQADAKTIVYCTEASPESFNPELGLGSMTYDVNAQLYNRLVELERGGSNLVAGLAKSWDISADGLKYTFHLRPGVKWHQTKWFAPTRDFNADDVLFTFDRQMKADNPYHSVGGGTYEYFEGLGFNEGITGVKRIDDLTVEITLKEPNASFLAALSAEPMSILSAEYAAAMLKAGTPDKVDHDPVGTGPFQLVAYEKDAVVRFKAFADYWAIKEGIKDRAPLVDTLVFAITPDVTVRAAKVMANECQVMLDPNPSDVYKLKSNPDIAVMSAASPYYGYIGFNVEKKPFDSKQVRMAITQAIDMPAIMKAVFPNDTAKQAVALVPPGFWGRDESLAPYPYDPANAKKLLAEAGYPNGFSTTLWAMPVQRPYMPNAKAAAQLIQQDLKAIGINVEIVSYEWGEYLKRTGDGEHDMVTLGWGYDYADPGQILVLGWTCAAVKAGANRSRWCNPGFDDLVMKAQRVSDQAERARLYEEAQKVFYDDVPALLVDYPTSNTVARKSLIDFKPHPFGGIPFYGVDVQ
jgi:dipeptide transport system substrate-binding protein